MFQTAQAYTALSRLTSKAGLYLLAFDASCLKADMKAVEEMERLRQVSGIAQQGLPPAFTAIRRPQNLQPPTSSIIKTPLPPASHRRPVRPHNLLGGTSTPTVNDSAVDFIPLSNPAFDSQSNAQRQNVCFANSTVQCLLNLPTVQEWLVAALPQDDLRDALLRVSNHPRGTPTNTLPLIDLAYTTSRLHHYRENFRNGNQHDLYEFTDHLVNSSPSLAKSFFFHQTEHLKCLNCNAPEYMTVNGSVKQFALYLKRPQQGRVTFTELLNNALVSDLTKRCDSCFVEGVTDPAGVLHRQTCRLDFTGCETLILHIPRHYTRFVGADNAAVSEVSNAVIDMDVESVMIANERWQVCSATHHTGQTINQGHYTAYTRTTAGWLKKNDENCSTTLLPQGLKDLYTIFLTRSLTRQPASTSVARPPRAELQAPPKKQFYQGKIHEIWETEEKQSAAALAARFAQVKSAKTQKGVFQMGLSVESDKVLLRRTARAKEGTVLTFDKSSFRGMSNTSKSGYFAIFLEKATNSHCYIFGSLTRKDQVPQMVDSIRKLFS